MKNANHDWNILFLLTNRRRGYRNMKSISSLFVMFFLLYFSLLLGEILEFSREAPYFLGGALVGVELSEKSIRKHRCSIGLHMITMSYLKLHFTSFCLPIMTLRKKKLSIILTNIFKLLSFYTYLNLIFK